MATAAIKVCDRCGKGVNAGAGRTALTPATDTLVISRIELPVDEERKQDIHDLSLDLCDRCVMSLCAWANEIKRRAAAKEGASQ